MRITTKKIGILFGATALFGALHAQNGLLNDLNTRPLTARAAALGNAAATLVDDASALSINPAGLAKIYGFQIVTTTELGYRNGKLSENGTIANFSEAEVKEVKPLIGLNQAAMSIPLSRDLNLGVGYSKLSNFTQFKEQWTVTQKDGSSVGKDNIDWNYYGAYHQLSTGLGWGTSRGVSKSNFYVGATVNRVFGTKYSKYNKTFAVNGNTTSNTVYASQLKVSGVYAGYGFVYETAAEYVDPSSYYPLPKTQFLFSLSGNLPYWRRNEAAGTNVLYTYKPGTLALGMGFRFVRYIDRYTHKFVTPIIQYEITDLSQNQTFYPTTGSADPALTGYNGNRLSMGIEFSNTETGIEPRLGVRFQNYVRKTGTGEQEKTWGICAGVGGWNVDFAATVDFFNSEKVLTYSGGGALDYKGAILGVMLTIRI